MHCPRILQGRDPDYQKLAVKGLIGSSKRVLTGTKNEEKIKAIKSGVAILEIFLVKFDAENRSSLNKAYLPADILDNLPQHKDKLIAEFVEVYTTKRNYKMLRTIEPKNSGDSSNTTWDIIRNKQLDKIKLSDDTELFKDNGEPTKKHLEMIYWAYSPQPTKVKSYYAVEAASGKTASKRVSTGESDSASPIKKKR